MTDTPSASTTFSSDTLSSDTLSPRALSPEVLSPKSRAAQSRAKSASNAGSAGTIITINPATEERLGTYPLPSNTAIAETVQLSQQAFSTFKETTLAQRANLLKRIAHRLELHGEPLAQAIAEENGKPISTAYETDVTLAVSSFKYIATHGTAHLSPKSNVALISLLLGRTHTTHKAPKGVVAIISPWNYPLAIPASGIASALMAGNSVILKPSELTPHIAKLLVEQIQISLAELNLPVDTVQCLIGNGATGEALLNQPINHVLFTGSVATGRLIQTIMGERGLTTNVELGGNCPMVVLPSVLETDGQQRNIIRQAIWGRYTNSGQTCAAVKRLIIPENYKDVLIPEIKRQCEALISGNPLQDDIHIGPLISKAHRDNVHQQVVNALAEGGKLVTGGYIPNKLGAFYPPTLITDLPAHANTFQHEIFGPVLLLQTYTTIDEAINLANGTPYGLTASVFGDLGDTKTESVAQKLQAGLVATNDVAMVNYGFQHVPWHGLKASGPGVSHSLKALDDCSTLRTLSKNHLFHWPGQSTPPWLFQKKGLPPSISQFSKAMLKLLSDNPILALFNLALIKGLLQRR